ncbi:AraC family transcriptional regulator [Ruminococcus sp.]|uniref:helix-turn-helix domain-containing protein n=1 Tax=Ruminococcus sp. TaxID=41978 RepID=UPI0025F43A70|nr:AraC family transcriptional regulator [Ruminococcus sp.]
MAVLQKIDNPYGMIQTVEHGESFSIYRSQDSTGDCEVTVYPVFSGIELVYYDVHMQSCDIDLAKGREMLIITHCQEGRIEFEYKNGEYLYLASGDLSIQKNTENIRHRYCPLSHYHGVSVAIDMNRVPRCFSCILDDVFVSPEELEMKFCSEKPYSIMRENISIEHIFSELYSVPENIRKGYHKVKVLELLLFLSGLEYKGESEERRYFSRSQVTAAKEAKKYLLAHLDEHITITELADMLGISSTSLKICFKGVYGDTINGYITNCKMQKAASLLKSTDKSVLEIAGIVGYNNGSKFAGAFRRVMNKSPNEYRKSLV